jgi:hypothetical protein
VIESLLGIPSGMVEGVFRFRCPLCAGHHTAINSSTNLSRCFQCERNFNAIDLCILVRRTNFVQSVKFLIEHQNRSSIPESRSEEENPVNISQPAREPLKDIVPLKDILSELIGKSYEKRLNQQHKTAPPDIPSMDDIADLEQIVHALSQIINRLKSCSHPK